MLWLSLTLGCGNTAPEVTITSPVSGETIPSGQPVNLHALLEDGESPTQFLDLSWRSDLIGELEGVSGRPQPDEVTLHLSSLSEGVHEITLEARDHQGLIGEDRVTVVILPNTTPELEFASPEAGQRFAIEQDPEVRVQVFLSDENEEYLNQLQLSWTLLPPGGEMDLPETPGGAGEVIGVISGLELGHYTLGLEVTDTLGGRQSSSRSFALVSGDHDQDGHVSQSFGGGDCDDSDPNTHPGGTEICGGLDEDCDGLVDESMAQDASVWYRDQDGDGAGQSEESLRACEPPDGYSGERGDCDDQDPDRSPLLEEVCASDVDEDCDGVTDEIESCISSVSEASLELLGSQESAHLGESLLLADWDGDGSMDFVVGAPDHDQLQERGGRVLVHSLLYKGSLTDEEVDWSLSGSQEGMRLGTALAAADLDQDGRAEVLVSAPGYGSREGMVAVLSERGLGATLVGSERDEELGRSMSGWGGELLIGAPKYEVERGRVFLWTGSIPRSAELETLAAASLTGDAAGDQFGAELLLKDVDGDGLSDALIAAPEDAQSAGVVALFLGPLGGTWSALDADAYLLGREEGDRLGAALAAGDLTGSGQSEIVLTSTDASEGAGEFWILSTEGLTGTQSVSSAVWKGEGEGADDELGSSVEILDWDQDGELELALGAPKGAGALENTGLVYLLQDLVEGQQDLSRARRWCGQQSGDRLGRRLAAQDVDGDGLTELAISASYARDLAEDGGSVYLLLGTQLP